MWNSNAIVAWLLTTAGIDARAVRMPGGGRAPGWDAGIAVARRAEGNDTARRRDHLVATLAISSDGRTVRGTARRPHRIDCAHARPTCQEDT